MGHADDLGDRHDGAQHVGHMGDRNQFGALAQKLGESVHAELALVGHRRDAQHHAQFVAQELPGDDVGMMLHLRQDDLVARLQELPAPRGGDKVDRFGRVAGKDDLAGLARIQEGADLLARGFHAVGADLAEIVDAAMHVGIFVLVDLALGVDHLARFLRRGRAVQEDQRLAMHRARQDREIPPGCVDVENRFHQCFSGRVHAAFSPSLSWRASTQPSIRARKASARPGSRSSSTASFRKAVTRISRAVASSMPRVRK